MKIKPPDALEDVKVSTKVPGQLYADAVLYAKLLGPKTSVEYVVLEALRSLLAHDLEFRRRRKEVLGSGGEDEKPSTPAANSSTASASSTAPPRPIAMAARS